MKDEILKLRSEGKTYNQIVKILKCSKGTVSYYCGEGQKEKWMQRQRENRNTADGIIRRKVDRFLRSRVREFKRRGKGFGGYDLGTKKSKTNSSISYISAYKKIINNPFCYLTGRKIDLLNNRSYELDHIISTARGGNNTLSNMGLASQKANQAKGALSVKEFIELCVEVCKHNGYGNNEIVKQ